jgi:hypothetical protein
MMHTYCFLQTTLLKLGYFSIYLRVKCNVHLRNDCHMQPMSHKVTNYHMTLETRGDIYIKACFQFSIKFSSYELKKKPWEVYSD